MRFFGDLPEEAKRYIAVMYKSVVDIANRNGDLCRLPTLRYIGVGPDPSQIIRDVPEPAVLVEMGK